MAVVFLHVAAAFQLMDGVQVTAAMSLRGLKDTSGPMWLAGASYWLAGAPMCALLGFGLGLDGLGVWLGLAFGLLVAAGSHGKFVSRLDIEVKDKKVTGVRYKLMPVFADAIKPDATMTALVEKVRAPFAKDLARKIGSTESLLYRRGNFNGTFDDLICDAMMSERDAEIALSPGFRWGETLIPGDAITWEDVTNATAITYPNCYRNQMTGAQIKTLLDHARAKPLTTDQPGRRLTGSLAFTGIALPLYSKSYWTYLTAALTKALQSDDGLGLLSLADTYYERSPDGTYANNSTEAFWAIGCLDDQPSADVADMQASAAAIQAAAPTVGYYFAYGAVICAKWPVPEVGPLSSYAAKGAAPILVVGTTNDPATPYAWAQSLSKLLSSGVLLTYKGEGHTAYGVANDCLNGAVDAYLLDGTVPADGTRC